MTEHIISARSQSALFRSSCIRSKLTKVVLVGMTCCSHPATALYLYNMHNLQLVLHWQADGHHYLILSLIACDLSVWINAAFCFFAEYLLCFFKPLSQNGFMFIINGVYLTLSEAPTTYFYAFSDLRKSKGTFIFHQSKKKTIRVTLGRHKIPFRSFVFVSTFGFYTIVLIISLTFGCGLKIWLLQTGHGTSL